MFEADSALAAVYRAGKIGDIDGATTVAICERRQRQLVQVSGWKRNFESVCDRLTKLLNCEIPLGCRRAVTSADRSIFRIGPERLWIIGPSSDEVLQQVDILSLGEEAVITEIGHSRTVLRITGPQSGVLINRGLPVDLNPNIFPANTFAQSAIHHIPVLVHRVDIAEELTFDIYVSRELAVSFWEWLTEAAAPLGCEVRHPDTPA